MRIEETKAIALRTANAGLGMEHGWKSACLASTKPYFDTLHLTKKLGWWCTPVMSALRRQRLEG